MAGVGWILAGNWWPYQRPTFVTPPFAGYISGHSTYSRAAAEVLTLLTNDPFFPRGLGEFQAPRNEFLVFEDGPSIDVTLQWATYRDAADQCSLSRIWGGIHPPADDIPGRLIGEKIGIDAFNYAVKYFNGEMIPTRGLDEVGVLTAEISIFPNPISSGEQLKIELNALDGNVEIELFNIRGQLVRKQKVWQHATIQTLGLNTTGLSSGVFSEIKRRQLEGAEESSYL